MKIVSKDTKPFVKNLGLVDKSMNFEKITSDAIVQCLGTLSNHISEKSSSPKSRKTKTNQSRLRIPSQLENTNSSQIFEEDRISASKLSFAVDSNNLKSSVFMKKTESHPDKTSPELTTPNSTESLQDSTPLQNPVTIRVEKPKSQLQDIQKKSPLVTEGLRITEEHHQAEIKMIPQ